MPIDIAAIGATGFHQSTTLSGTEVFSISLYKLDRLIEEWKECKQASLDKDAENEHLVQQLLPGKYTSYRDVFSKQESNTLPLRRAYNHHIQIEPGKTFNLKYSPLYNSSAAELQATKKYIVENLNKGFIKASQAPFAAPILFTTKPNGGLHFYIDYHKLNELTIKD